MVKNTAPFFGTLPAFVISSGLMRTKARSSNAAKLLKSLKAWPPRSLRSARYKMRGCLDPSRASDHRALNSFHAIWNAMDVLPVPVAKVRRMRSALALTRPSTHATAISW